ncbi:hypothetical protein LIER_35133 [Lithospermum erythrorhizon]|uniref:Transposase-associated domain-containing protein n=1 Tax=Lithospermum erythrorhizon TaxID=34254 RepID=A0AAV3NKC9_LITER
MDKSWMKLTNFTSAEYLNRIDVFLNFTFSNKSSSSKIYFPCTKCQNRLRKTRLEVKFHCIRDGFDKNYNNWHYHRKYYVISDRNNDISYLNNRVDMLGMLHDAMGIQEMDKDIADNQSSDSEDFLEVNNETRTFF